MTIAEQLLAEGKAEGIAVGKARMLVAMLENHGIQVDAQTRTRLESMAPDDLDALAIRSASVSSVDELLGR